MNKTLNILSTLEKYILLSSVFLFPILVLPFFSNPFDFPKIVLLSLSVLFISIIKVIKTIFNNEFKLNKGYFDIFVVLFLVVNIASTFLTKTGKVDALFIPGNAMFAILGGIIYIFINQENDKFKKNIENTLIASIFTFSVIHILAFTGITNLLKPLSEIFKIKSFSSFGNIFTSIVVMVATLPILISKITENGKDIYEKILSSLITFVVILSASLSIYISFTDKAIYKSVLDYKYGVPLVMDSLKENFILGSGPSGFSYIFNKHKPIEHNRDNEWNLKYNQSSSQILTTITETGFLGLISILVLIYLLYKHGDLKNPQFINTLIIMLGIIFLPVSASIYVLLLINISIFSRNTSLRLGFFEKKMPKTILLIPFILIIVVLLYILTRATYAEYLYAKAMKYATTNEAVKAYDTINLAVKQNRYYDKYHLYSASINLSLADAIANKENITEEDRDTISKLIQQSIREIKASVATNTRKSTNWEAMSDLYKVIMTFAKGSDTFAIESLRQAIALDPTDPNLRIKLGELFYTLDKYDLAIDSFKLAIIAKPDLANAHYNLALAYKANKNLDKAKESINNTLKLVGKEGVGYEAALKELSEIESLTKPEEKIESSIEPQIEMPQENQESQDQLSI